MTVDFPRFPKGMFYTIMVLGLTGCAMSTGILPAGPDTYTVTERFAPIRGGSTTAQQTALSEANAYCAGQNKQFLVLDKATLPSSNPYGTTSYSVTFRCLNPGEHVPVPAEVIQHQYAP